MNRRILFKFGFSWLYLLSSQQNSCPQFSAQFKIQRFLGISLFCCLNYIGSFELESILGLLALLCYHLVKIEGFGLEPSRVSRENHSLNTTLLHLFFHLVISFTPSWTTYLEVHPSKAKSFIRTAVHNRINSTPMTSELLGYKLFQSMWQLCYKLQVSSASKLTLNWICSYFFMKFFVWHL